MGSAANPMIHIDWQLPCLRKAEISKCEDIRGYSYMENNTKDIEILECNL